MMLPLLDPGAGPAAVELETHDPVLRELWISFVSLLRSHLGALQTTGRLVQAQFVALSSAEVEVVDLARTLHLGIQPSTGEGEWSVRRMGEMIAAGVWVLRSDATATIDEGRTQDMELAVEAFVEKLWKRGLNQIAPGGDEETAV